MDCAIHPLNTFISSVFSLGLILCWIGVISLRTAQCKGAAAVNVWRGVANGILGSQEGPGVLETIVGINIDRVSGGIFLFTFGMHLEHVHSIEEV